MWQFVESDEDDAFLLEIFKSTIQFDEPRCSTATSLRQVFAIEAGVETVLGAECVANRKSIDVATNATSLNWRKPDVQPYECNSLG
jgi:hypothetical protein